MPPTAEKQCAKCRKRHPRIDFIESPGEPPSRFCGACRNTRKVCRRCGELKPITEFARNKGDEIGFCKACYSRARASLYAKRRARLDARYGTDRPKDRFGADGDPEEVLLAPRRRRAERLKAARRAPIDREAIFERDKWRCWICGERVEREDATLDHVIPIARGGSDEPANVKLAHGLCNSRRGAQLPSIHT